MTLKWSLVTKGVRPHAQLQGKLEQKIAKLETHLEHFPSDAVHLQVNLERHPKRVWFDAALTLRLPSNVLQSNKSGPDPLPVFDQAIKALLREVAGSSRPAARERLSTGGQPEGLITSRGDPRLRVLAAASSQDSKHHPSRRPVNSHARRTGTLRRLRAPRGRCSRGRSRW